MRRLLRAVCGVGLAIALGMAHADQAVQIRDVVAYATPPNATVANVFMTITAAQNERLLSVTTDAAEKAEIHSAAVEGGMMRMRPLTSLPLPAGKEVLLGMNPHIMLIGLKKPLVDGDHFLVQLHFEHAGERTVRATVTRPKPLDLDSHSQRH